MSSFLVRRIAALAALLLAVEGIVVHFAHQAGCHAHTGHHAHGTTCSDQTALTSHHHHGVSADADTCLACRYLAQRNLDTSQQACQLFVPTCQWLRCAEPEVFEDHCWHLQRVRAPPRLV